MKNSKKILCIPYTHTLSHISRPLQIAKELRSRGHVLFFAGESSNIEFILKEGFNVWPLYEPNPTLLFDNIRKGKLKFIEQNEIERMIKADLELYHQTKPDIVITDGRFSAPLSTQIAGLMHAAIVNVSSTEYRALPYVPIFDWLSSIGLCQVKKGSRILDSLNLKIEMLIFDHAMYAFKRLSKKYKLKRTVTATNCLTGNDFTLLPDIPEYFPVRNLPDNYLFIGPLTFKSTSPPPSWWPPPKNGQPLIYITMGTTGIGHFFNKVIDYLKNKQIRAIITTGGQVQNLKGTDGKIYIEPFIDGDLVIEASDLVVCHGGNGTIYQALSHGKPIVGTPTIPDQEYNMRRVDTLGVGKSIPWKIFLENPESLFTVIEQVLKSRSLKYRAKRFQILLKKYQGEKIGADLIEKFLE